MSRCHGNDASFVGKGVIGVVSILPQNLKWSDICKLGEDLGDMVVTSFRNVQHSILVSTGWKEWLRCIGEVVMEWESFYNSFRCSLCRRGNFSEPRPGRLNVD